MAKTCWAQAERHHKFGEMTLLSSPLVYLKYCREKKICKDHTIFWRKWSYNLTEKNLSLKITGFVFPVLNYVFDTNSCWGIVFSCNNIRKKIYSKMISMVVMFSSLLFHNLQLSNLKENQKSNLLKSIQLYKGLLHFK